MRSRLLPIFATALIILGLAGCGASGPDLPTLTSQPADLEFSVRADGELVASESMPISLPGSIRMSFNVAWLAPEFSDVREGDVIARFDDVQVKLEKESSSLNVAKSEFKLADAERDGLLERTRIGHESLRVDGERNISEAFSAADERLFSRNELIDILADLDYLDVESSFLDWQYETLDRRMQAEQNFIMAERQGELSKLEKQEKALEMMELRSPADGTFVYARTPWGEKLGKGKTIYPGMPIGLLPVRGKVKTRLYVPEADAVGLAVGQLVRFRLDSAAEREFTGRVVEVSPVASPRTREDPQKFFRLDAEIDEVDPELMRVGSRLRAEIITGEIEQGLVVPAQAIHGEAGNTYVFVVNGRQVERRDVVLGRRSPDLVELKSGIEPGDRISLVTPVGES
ncbi:MAG: efflux RND transporter periplasmic adaptor subunit [Gammaproteobacteria bacterium]|nr:efflux RND transporter periplasmic adaptor subunit [Gammaproteobacteria bacterium]